MDPIVNNNSLRFILKYFRAIGIWSIGCSNRTLYYTWTAAYHSVFTILYIISMGTNIVLVYEMKDFYISLAVFAMFFKMINVFNHQKRIQNMLNRLHFAQTFQVNDQDPQEVKLIQNKFGFFSKITTCYKYVSLGTCSMGLVSAFSDPPQKSYPGWYPFGLDDLSKPKNFWGIFIYQNIGMFSHALMNVTWDSLLVYFMINIQVQFELLNIRVRKEFLEITAENEEKLKRVFKSYNEIISFNAEVEDIFGMGMFAQFNLSAVILCTTTILMINISPLEHPAEFLLYLFFFLSMISQILLPCYFGNEITLESIKLRDSMYHTNWLDMSVKDRKLMIKFVERLKRPAKIHAWEFFGLNLVTFTKILNTSYSFFAILKNAH